MVVLSMANVLKTCLPGVSIFMQSALCVSKAQAMCQCYAGHWDSAFVMLSFQVHAIACAVEPAVLAQQAYKLKEAHVCLLRWCGGCAFDAVNLQTFRRCHATCWVKLSIARAAGGIASASLQISGGKLSNICITEVLKSLGSTCMMFMSCLVW
jgi:hypothetical protein